MGDALGIARGRPAVLTAQHINALSQVSLKAKGHAASPRTALDLLARNQRRRARIGERAVDGLSTTTPEQREFCDTLSLPKPA